MFIENLWMRLTWLTLPEPRRYCSVLKRRMLRALCAVRGHELMLHFERDHMCLRCVGCGFETRGWRL